MLLFSLLLNLLSFSTSPAAPANDVPASVFISTNQGGTWLDFMAGIPTGAMPRNLVEHKGDLYLSTHSHGLFILREDQENWALISNGIPFTEDFFLPTALAVKGDVIILGTYQHGIYYSHDGGKHWQQPAIRMRRAPRSFLFTKQGLLAGTDQGLYHSFDQGETWLRLNEDYDPIVNALTIHKGAIIVARQNGFGVLTGKEVIWSDQKSDWALLQLTSRGGFVYASNAKGEVFRSQDGLNWEARPILSLPLNCNSLPEALWNGFTADLPDGQETNTLHETSRGWIALVGGGC